MSLPDHIREFLSDWDLEPSGILVAASAGTDSTALLLAMVEADLGGEIVAAHVNHHLRGHESDEDEKWLRHLCGSRGIRLEVVDGLLDDDEIRQVGVEAAARSVRYRELESIRERVGADLIATGHHMNDQAETVLMRLISGSGVSRLRGILPIIEGTIIRPMLEVPRGEIDQFVSERGIQPRQDTSNLDPRYLRNRIRNEILPLLRDLNPQVERALSETARQAREQAAEISDFLDLESEGWVRSTNQTAFDARSLSSRPWITEALLLREAHRLDPVGREISKHDLREIVSDIPSTTRRSISRELELVRDGDRMILRKLLPSGVAFDEPVHPGHDVEIPVIGATVRLAKIAEAGVPFTDALRLRQVFRVEPGTREQFAIRSRRPGDRFQPLGLLREKRLNEFLIDRKIPAEDRDRLPLLTCDEQIVWIGGVEVSEQFKVTGAPGALFEVSVTYHGGRHERESPA